MSHADELAEYVAWERRQTGYAFAGTETRHARLKRRLDCGHVIDGSEPYRYFVGKVICEASLTQRTDCEFCAHVDSPC